MRLSKRQDKPHLDSVVQLGVDVVSLILVDRVTFILKLARGSCKGVFQALRSEGKVCTACRGGTNKCRSSLRAVTMIGLPAYCETRSPECRAEAGIIVAGETRRLANNNKC